MSPSWTRSQHKRKTLQRSSIWGGTQQKWDHWMWLGAPTYSAAWAGVLLGRTDSYMRLRTGKWLPTWALHRELWGVGGVARLPGQHARLVGGVGGHPWCRWCMEAFPEGTGFLWDSLGEVPGPSGQQWLFCTPCPKMYQQEGIPASSRPQAALPRLQGGTTTEDPGLHPGPSVLGWESQPTRSWWKAHFGKMCPGIKACHEAFHHL